MRKIIERAVCCATLVIALVCTPLLWAQQPTDLPPAPVPSQIITSKKIFISNASGESNLPPGIGDLTYNTFYASLKGWGRYELVSTPADADLVFEIHYEIIFGPVYVNAGGGGSDKFPQIRLSILDLKTHIILWAFSEPVVKVSKKSTDLQNFQHAMDNLMNDIKTLAARGTAPAIGPND